MKQYISIDQYAELTDKQRDTLISKGYGSHMNIGEMIEFIKEETGECNIHSWQLIDPKKDWTITSHNEHAKDLVDALWKVVKKILKKEV